MFYKQKNPNPNKIFMNWYEKAKIFMKKYLTQIIISNMNAENNKYTLERFNIIKENMIDENITVDMIKQHTTYTNTYINYVTENRADIFSIESVLNEISAHYEKFDKDYNFVNIIKKTIIENINNDDYIEKLVECIQLIIFTENNDDNDIYTLYTNCFNILLDFYFAKREFDNNLCYCIPLIFLYEFNKSSNFKLLSPENRKNIRNAILKNISFKYNNYYTNNQKKMPTGYFYKFDLIFILLLFGLCMISFVDYETYKEYNNTFVTKETQHKIINYIFKNVPMIDNKFKKYILIMVGEIKNKLNHFPFRHMEYNFNMYLKQTNLKLKYKEKYNTFFDTFIEIMDFDVSDIKNYNVNDLYLDHFNTHNNDFFLNISISPQIFLQNEKIHIYDVVGNIYSDIDDDLDKTLVYKYTSDMDIISTNCNTELYYAKDILFREKIMNKLMTEQINTNLILQYLAYFYLSVIIGFDVETDIYNKFNKKTIIYMVESENENLLNLKHMYATKFNLQIPNSK